MEHQALKENHPGLYAVIDAERYPTPQDRPTAIVRKVDTGRFHHPVISRQLFHLSFCSQKLSV